VKNISLHRVWQVAEKIQYLDKICCIHLLSCVGGLVHFKTFSLAAPPPLMQAVMPMPPHVSITGIQCTHGLLHCQESIQNLVLLWSKCVEKQEYVKLF
jgi:hypothetical protein